jgi:hypothetical protein
MDNDFNEFVVDDWRLMHLAQLGAVSQGGTTKQVLASIRIC